jgi:uncharacterized membrane protein YhhN
MVGALMFMASDFILSLELFVLDPQSALRKITRHAIWGLYWCGQALIAWPFLVSP